MAISTAGVSSVAGSHVVKKRNRKSYVWKEFVVRSDENGKVIESERVANVSHIWQRCPSKRK